MTFRPGRTRIDLGAVDRFAGGAMAVSTSTSPVAYGTRWARTLRVTGSGPTAPAGSWCCIATTMISVITRR